MKTPKPPRNGEDPNMRQLMKLSLVSDARALERFLGGDSDELNAFISRRGDRPNDELIEIANKRLRMARKGIARMILSPSEWFKFYSLDKAKTIKKLDDYSNHYRFERSINQTVVYVALYKKGYRAPKPTKQSELLSDVRARTLRREWQFLHPSRLVLINSDMHDRLKAEPGHRVEVWGVFDFLECRFPGASPGELLRSMLLDAIQHQLYEGKRDGSRNRGNRTGQQGAEKRAMIIRKKYSELRNTPDNKMEKKNWFIKEVLMPALPKNQPGFKMRTVQKAVINLE